MPLESAGQPYHDRSLWRKPDPAEPNMLHPAQIVKSLTHPNGIWGNNKSTVYIAK